jgi:hypothetical protein
LIKKSVILKKKVALYCKEYFVLFCSLSLLLYSFVQYFLLSYVFTFLVRCCDVRYNFDIKTMFGSSCHPVLCRRAHVLFMLFVFVYVYRYNGVHHILTIWVTWRVSYKKQELLILRGFWWRNGWVYFLNVGKRGKCACYSYYNISQKLKEIIKWCQSNI